MQGSITPLFSTPVLAVEIPVPQGLCDYCLKMDKNNSLRGAINVLQSEKNIHHDSELFTLYLNEYFFFPLTNLLKNIFNGTLDLTSSWVNVSTKDSYNFQHSHPNCDLSFIWYVKAPEENCGGEVVFTNPNYFNNSSSKGCMKSEYIHQFNYFTDYKITPQDGMCLVFPSYLEHRVNKLTKECDRISYVGNFSFATNPPITRFILS